MNTGKGIITKFHSIGDAELSLADTQWLIQNIDKAINSTKQAGQVEPEVSQENCVWEILSKNGDSFYIILADCQKPHTMADSLFATTIYKYCPHCGRKLKSKLSSNFSG